MIMRDKLSFAAAECSNSAIMIHDIADSCACYICVRPWTALSRFVVADLPPLGSFPFAAANAVSAGLLSHISCVQILKMLRSPNDQVVGPAA